MKICFLYSSEGFFFYIPTMTSSLTSSTRVCSFSSWKPWIYTLPLNLPAPSLSGSLPPAGRHANLLPRLLLLLPLDHPQTQLSFFTSHSEVRPHQTSCIFCGKKEEKKKKNLETSATRHQSDKVMDPKRRGYFFFFAHLLLCSLFDEENFFSQSD